MQWLRGDVTLDISVRGVGASVRFVDDTLELHRDVPTNEGAGAGANEGEGETDQDATIELVIRHPLVRSHHVWIPHLAPTNENVIGDAVFRSPAILLADKQVAIAFIPDLDDVRDAAVKNEWRAWLDYVHPQSTITLAAGAYREDGHVFYTRSPLHTKSSVSLRMHVITSHREEDRQNPYGMAARWIWERWGRRVSKTSRSSTPLTPLMDYVVRWAFSRDGWGESVWQHVNLDGASLGAPVFIVDVTRHPSVPHAKRQWREPRSIWNQAWFSTQRCANGLLRYARQVKLPDLEQRARMMTEIALAAPQDHGLFPAVLMAIDDADPAGGWRWLNSNRRPPSASDAACHIVDAAFTCRMLLEWYALTKDERAYAYVLRFADRLLQLQHTNGSFPGWVEPDGRIPNELAAGPESAVSIALLFELNETRFHHAALKGLAFLEHIANEGQWEDFETYYSCAPWGNVDQLGHRVPRNGVYKQNTLSIAWCAEAFLHAWQRTHNAAHLDLARRCVDELSLYQAVWDPPWLPAPAHGGFGVMNADCEWNDARQSLFAPLYLELGRVMNDRELQERGVSAMRASFSMLYCPENGALAKAYEARFPFFGPESYGFMMENQGHSGAANPIGTFTIFTWGNGSALATAALVRDRFPEHIVECGLAIPPTP